MTESTQVAIFDQDKNTLWDLYCGAENFPDGSPVYREIGKWSIVMDREGIEATDYNEGDGTYDKTFYRYFTLGSQKLAIALLTGLPEDFDPAQFNMEEL